MYNKTRADPAFNKARQGTPFKEKQIKLLTASAISCHKAHFQPPLSSLIQI